MDILLTTLYYTNSFQYFLVDVGDNHLENEEVYDKLDMVKNPYFQYTNEVLLPLYVHLFE